MGFRDCPAGKCKFTCLSILADLWQYSFNAAYTNDIPVLPGWGGRAKRTHANMAENLLPFACLIFIAYSSGRMGELSVLGAQIFFVSRLAYALLYIGGVTVLRSLAYFGGLVGMVLIVVQVL